MRKVIPAADQTGVGGADVVLAKAGVDVGRALGANRLSVERSRSRKPAAVRHTSVALMMTK